jgi:hypothetical protein
MVRRQTRIEARARYEKRYRIHVRRFGQSAHSPPSVRENFIRSTKRRELVVDLPSVLSLSRNCSSTLKALGFVREASQSRVLLRYLNFENLNYVSPAAALLLASELDEWNRTSQGRLSARDSTWTPEVRRQLSDMGLFELLHLERPTDLALRTARTFLPFIRGEIAADRATAGARTKELNRKIQEVAGAEIKKHLLFHGLSEAITNVSHHAYPQKVKNKPWWMFASYDSDEGEVTVVFLDHGLTIPVTLPAWKGVERLREIYGGWKDAHKIHAAMELGRSGTGSLGRGKGLPNFLDIIKVHPGSSLRIFSRKGLLTVRSEREKPLTFESTSLARSMKGTLIEWKFVPKSKVK